MSFKQFASCEPPKKKENEEPSEDEDDIFEKCFSSDEDSDDEEPATFYVTVSLIEGKGPTDATDSVFEDLQIFLKPYDQNNRDELHFEVEEDKLQVQIERYGGNVEKLIENFANWILKRWAEEGEIVESNADCFGSEYEVNPLFKNLMEEIHTEEGLDFMGEEMISYIETTESIRGTDKIQNWFISLTDYGFSFITVVEAEAKKQQDANDEMEEEDRQRAARNKLEDIED